MPLLFAAGIFVGLSNTTPDTTYNVAVLASASRSVIALGPLLAAAIAFRSGALATYLQAQLTTRQPLRAYWVALWPLIILGPAAAVLAATWATRSIPTSRYTLAISAVIFMTVLGCAMFGLALSLALPRLAAVPVSAVVTYLWLAYPATGGDAVLRNINGSFVGCCTIDQYPAKSMIFGSSSLLLVLLLGTLIVVAAGHTRVLASSILAITLILAWGTAAAVTTAVDKTPSLMAVQPRTGATTCRTASGVELCVWPEHRSRLVVTSAVVARVANRLVSGGLESVPARYAENPRDGFAQIQVADGAGDADIAFSMVANFLPDRQSCRPVQGYNVYSKYEDALQWLAIKAGLTPNQTTQRLGDSIAPAVHEILTQDQEHQVGWYLAVKALLERDCDK